MTEKDLTRAVMLIRTRASHIRDVFNSLKSADGVTAGCIVAGPYDIVCFLRGNGWDDLFGIIKSIRGVSNIKSTVTLPVHRYFGEIPKQTSAIILTRVMRGDVDAIAGEIYEKSGIVNHACSVAGPYDVILTVDPNAVENSIELKEKVISSIRIYQEIKDTLTLEAGPDYFYRSVV